MSEVDLVEWLNVAAQAVGLESSELNNETVDAVLGLASDAAHNVVRPAAPVATFVLGLALGAGFTANELRAVRTSLTNAASEFSDRP